nr:terminase gpA endonuclease subunit [Bartonella capreoli]
MTDTFEKRKLDTTYTVSQWADENHYLTIETSGEPLEDKSGEVIDPGSLYAQREDYPLAPAQVVLLTAGINVQDDCLEIEVVGWGRDEESWNIDYQVLPDDPCFQEVWDQLDEYFKKRWPHPGFKDGIRIAAACIDVAGHNIQPVYNYVRSRERKCIWGIKGRTGSRPVWPHRPSKNNEGQINLYTVGVDSAKDIITNRFRKSGSKASEYGATHFHKNLDREYFEQLTAEKRVTKYLNGHERIEWHKSNTAKNGALNCRVYAYAALQGLILAGLNLNKEVDILEDRLKNLQSSQYLKRLKPEPQKQQTAIKRNPYVERGWGW